MDVMERERARDTGGATGNSGELLEVREKRGRVDALSLAFASDEGVVTEYAQWQYPCISNKWRAAEVISVRLPGECNQSLGQELYPEAERRAASLFDSQGWASV